MATGLAQVKALPKPRPGATRACGSKLHRGIWSVIGALDHSLKRSVLTRVSRSLRQPECASVRGRSAATRSAPAARWTSVASDSDAPQRAHGSGGALYSLIIDCLRATLRSWSTIRTNIIHPWLAASAAASVPVRTTDIRATLTVWHSPPAEVEIGEMASAM
jgi:hypothetical protein